MTFSAPSRVVVAMVLAACLGSQAETINVYGDANHAPLGYLEAGVPKGVLVDMFAKISKKTGDTYNIKLYPWGRAQLLAKTEPGALMNVSMNAARMEVFDFSEPMYFDDVVVVVLKAKPLVFNQLSDLKGLTLGGNVGGSYGEEIDRLIADKVFAIEHDSSPVARLRKLLAGRMAVALIPGGKLGFESALAEDPVLASQRDKLLILDKPFVRDPLYLAVSKRLDKKALIARFNQALKEIQK